jgi:sugar diacid utilization regulator
MNERIKELESQCWEARQYGPPWFNAKKFAELIVRECAEIALEQKKWVEDMKVHNPHDEVWNKARIQQSQHIVDKIKEHFGVE